MTSGIFSYLGGDSELSHTGESSTFFNQTWDDWLVSYSDCLKPPTSEKYIFFSDNIIYIYVYMQYNIYIYVSCIAEYVWCSFDSFVHGECIGYYKYCMCIYIIRIDCDMIVKCERHQE